MATGTFDRKTGVVKREGVVKPEMHLGEALVAVGGFIEAAAAQN